MKRVARAVALAAMAGTLCASSVFADDSAQTPTSGDTNNALRVIVDPETGEVRAPTREELQALIQAQQAAQAAERSARTALRAAPATTAQQVLPESKTVERHTNGMVSMRLPQESLSLVKVEKDVLGKARLVHANESTTVGTAQEK